MSQMTLKYIYICTEISEVNLSAFIYRLFHEDFSSIIRTNTVAYSQPIDMPYIQLFGGAKEAANI